MTATAAGFFVWKIQLVEFARSALLPRQGVLFVIWRCNHYDETYLSAQEAPSLQGPRLPQENADRQWP